MPPACLLRLRVGGVELVVVDVALVEGAVYWAIPHWLQRLMHEQLATDWPAVLHDIARSLNLTAALRATRHANIEQLLAQAA